MFHPMVAGVTIPGMGLVRADPRPVHRPQPEQQARGPQVRHLAVHDLPHVLGRARHDRLVLPRPGFRLRLPVERRPVLRPVRNRRLHHRSLVIVIPVLVLLAVALMLFVVAAPARHRRAAIGALSARDAQARPRQPPRRRRRARRRPPAARSSAAAAARARARPAELVAGRRAGAAGAVRRRPTPRRSASPAASSSTAASSAASCLGLSGLRRRRCSRSCGRRSAAASARRSASASSPTSRPRSPKGSGFAYYPEGRMWITDVPGGRAREGEEGVHRRPSSPAWRPGSSRSTRSACTSAAACRSCLTSQWFECPCHGSQYNRVGEKKGGPAPRGLDRFAMTVAGGVLTSTPASIILGPADRHQHHRPRGRGSPLHQAEAERTDAVAASTQTAIGGSSSSSPSSSRVVYAFINIRQAQAPRSARRSSSRPTASPTYPTRSSRAASSTARSTSACSACSSSRLGLPLYWLNEPGRQAARVEGLRGASSSSRGAAHVRTDRRGRVQLRGLPRRQGRRRRGAVHDHERPRATSWQSVDVEGAGAQHRAAALQP